jgi:hypothetical protein
MGRLPTRRLLLAAGAALAVASASSAQDRRMTAYKTPWCGCCDGWVAHMRAAGWTVQVVELEDLAPIRARHGVPHRYAGCHTAVAAGYAIEGHVPAADVERLLISRPAAAALAAPGMPAGSPGMEAAGREPYVTLLIDRAGRASIFGRHNGA